MNIITQKKQIIPLPQRPIWSDNAGLNKGIDHDRQHLAIILPAQQPLKIRQINPDFTQELTLHLLNDDSQTEASIQVGSSWVELSVDATAVPFIQTPYGTAAPTIEYQYPSTAKQLPIFRKGEDESAFFQLWDEQDAEFALVESEYAIILVPKISKNDLKELKTVKNIDGLINYYESIFTLYNTLIGLSFSPQAATDQNIPNHYFMKADKHGGGAAYYGVNWTAETSPSVSEYWLSPDATNWGSLHEIGHGYQGSFMGDSYFSPGEVWNNIYAACYQNIMLGDRKYEEGWLARYGNLPDVEQELTDRISRGEALNEWDVHSKIYFLMLMIEKAGMVTFTHFNQQYRRKANQEDFIVGEHYLLDNLSESFADTGNQVDVTPFIQFVNGYITPAQYERNLFKHSKVVYPLNQLVPEDILATLQQQLNIRETYSLVDTEQLRFSGLTGNVTLKFTIDDLSQIYANELILMDVANAIYHQPIIDEKMVLNELPIGAYKLHLPTGKNKKYLPSTNYLIVKEGNHQQELTFCPKIASSIVTQTISLRGIGNDEFGYIDIDHSQEKITLAVNYENPHNYFPDQTYVIVTIINKDGEEIFNKIIPGTHATVGTDEISFAHGDKIKIHHIEPSRVQIEPFFPDIIDNTAIDNILEITPYGLKNEQLNNDPKKALLERLEKAAAKVRDNYAIAHADFAVSKDNIYLAIDIFPSPQREDLLAQYKDCLPIYNSALDDKQGNNFTFKFNGIYNITFLTAQLNLVKKEITINVESGVPHEYFKETYAVFCLLDKYGNELLNLNIQGNDNLSAQSWVFPISGNGGEKVYIRHEESDGRLIITNDMQQKPVAEMGNTQNYQITKTGLLRIEEPS